ncbi:MAG: hypothetical protein KDD10_05195 [Phaeodactylibacter sp.]|nr:hypothetical protein [Phaeodactylibacter sp.]MCB9293793.1 hypothetical protein [Lewinellaceae bacterium]
MKKNTSILLFLTTYLCHLAIAQNLLLRDFEGYYLAQGQFPRDAGNLPWFPNDTEMQGVTNDGANWFFTMTPQDESNGIMWRIPKSRELGAGINEQTPGVDKVAMSDVQILRNNNYWHWGDPDHYEYEGVDYILVPVTEGAEAPVILCFRADNLAYVNYAKLRGGAHGGWCAVGTDGYIYSSSNHPDKLRRYEVDWSIFTDPNSGNHDVITYLESYTLKNSDGSTLQLRHMQGGEFSRSGELLYVVCGTGGCLGQGDGPNPTDGIHVFETHTWREVQHSFNNYGLENYFSYTFDNTCKNCLGGIGGFGSQTPEGLTVWNLDDGSAPNIRGQLHVLTNWYTFAWACSDEFSLHHFSRNVYVDSDNGVIPPTSPRTGTRSKPFRTVNDAYSFYQIWDGAQMVIKAGTYSDTGIYSTRIRMVSEGGSTVIGQQ